MEKPHSSLCDRTNRLCFGAGRSIIPLVFSSPLPSHSKGSVVTRGWVVCWYSLNTEKCFPSRVRRMSLFFSIQGDTKKVTPPSFSIVVVVVIVIVTTTTVALAPEEKHGQQHQQQQRNAHHDDDENGFGRGTLVAVGLCWCRCRCRGGPRVVVTKLGEHVGRGLAVALACLVSSTSLHNKVPAFSCLNVVPHTTFFSASRISIRHRSMAVSLPSSISIRRATKSFLVASSALGSKRCRVSLTSSVHDRSPGV